MKSVKIGTLVCITSLMAGCGGGGSDKQLLLGPGATEAEAVAAIDALLTDVEDVFFADGTTEYTALPADSASYTGLIFGVEGGGDGPLIDHAADLELTVDFDNDAVSGRVSNFVTSVVDFENPTGTINVSGTVSNGFPDAQISFDGTGNLTGSGGVTAQYDLLSADGVFGGTDGSVVSGFQETDFFWLTGPDALTISNSDGGFAATRD